MSQLHQSHDMTSHDLECSPVKKKRQVDPGLDSTPPPSWMMGRGQIDLTRGEGKRELTQPVCSANTRDPHSMRGNAKKINQGLYGTAAGGKEHI